MKNSMLKDINVPNHSNNKPTLSQSEDFSDGIHRPTSKPTNKGTNKGQADQNYKQTRQIL